jgi:hypothetical protein
VKKAVAIFLFWVYGITSVGATIHFHYCMDELVGCTLGYHEDDGKICNRCGMEENEGSCCRNEYRVCKINIDQTKPFWSPQLSTLTKDYCDHFFNINISSHKAPIDLYTYGLEDPPKFTPNRRLHLLFGVFLI